jgi:hypothetical protein
MRAVLADHERMRVEHKQAESLIRAVLPKLLDQYKLAARHSASEILATLLSMG